MSQHQLAEIGDRRLEARTCWRSPPLSVILGKPTASRVYNAFVWPIFAGFRQLLQDVPTGEVAFRADPVALFDDLRNKLAMIVQNYVTAQRRRDDLGHARAQGRARCDARSTTSGTRVRA